MCSFMLLNDGIDTVKEIILPISSPVLNITCIGKNTVINSGPHGELFLNSFLKSISF